MALRDWQAALGQLVEARSAGREQGPVLSQLGGLAISAEERDWLRGVTDTPGFALTAEVPRWWRHVRVRRSARLTRLALRENTDAVVSEYLRAVPCFSLFFIAEGLAFLEYVAHTVTLPHVRPVAELERAIWALKLATAQTTKAAGGAEAEAARKHPAARAEVLFQAPPQAVLAALLSGAPLPELEPRHYPVFVAPDIPGFWRLATPA